MYVYVYVCVCVHMYICMCMYVCMHVCIYMYVYMYVCMHRQDMIGDRATKACIRQYNACMMLLYKRSAVEFSSQPASSRSPSHRDTTTRSPTITTNSAIGLYR